MPISKDKKPLYVAVLVIAGIALVADRVFFGDDENPGIQAADASIYAAQRTSPSSSPPPPPVQRTATSAIADVLAGRRENAAEPIDAFNARRVFSDGAVPLIDDTETNPLIPPETFAAMHQLRSVIVGDGTSGAVRVGRRTLRIGDELDGYTLAEIRPRLAIFAAGDVRAELRLGDAQQSAD